MTACFVRMVLTVLVNEVSSLFNDGLTVYRDLPQKQSEHGRSETRDAKAW